MKKNHVFLFLLIVLSTFCTLAFSLKKKQVQVVQMHWLDSVLSVQNDTTYIFNFWATWCIPCVAELPEFEKITKTSYGKKVKVIMISLDYVKKLDELIIPFLEKKKILSEVVLLNEPDANKWIDKVDTNWSGAIPATLIVNNSASFRLFLEKELNFGELDSVIKNNFNK